MAHRRSLRWIGRGVAATVVSATLLSALPASASPWSGNQFEFANDSFHNLWNQTDANPGNRSLTWGPRPWWDYKEFYKQSPNGLRQVQYFDKSRMEINDPNASKTPYFVTNGLLPREMISGRVKLGEGDGPDQYDQREPAAIPVAGDLAKVNPDAPTYASFRLVATTNNDHPATAQLGQRVTATFDKSGNIGSRPDLGLPGTEIAAFNANTNHNVPAVFKNYMDFYDQAGGVTSLFAFGYPITEPYWIRARVGGVDKDVMVQIFERRVLTFTPSNPDQYQVEMGNVGQHYFQWRYPNQGTPWDAPPVYIPVAFGSNRKTQGHLEIYTTDPNGTSQSNITSGGSESRPFSMLRSWDQKQIRIIGTSNRDTNKSQLYSFTIDGSSQKRILESTANDYNPSVSPDGTKIAFASDRDGNADLFLMDIASGAVAQLTTTTACINEYPTWEGNGSGLVYNSNCTGNFEIFRAELKYTQDKAGDLKATLANPINLTNSPAADRYPRISPDGSKIAFQSNRDGNGELYVTRRDGSATTRLTFSSGGNEEAPSWSPDGTQLVYDSDVEGDFEVYIRNLDPNSAPRQLTNNGQDDRWAVYAQ